MTNDHHDFSTAFLVTFVALIVAYIAIGFGFGLFGPLLADLADFLGGDAAAIRAKGGSVPVVIADAAAMAVLTLPFSIIPAKLVQRVLPAVAPGAQPDVLLFPPRPDKPSPTGFKALLLALHKIGAIVLIEEFYARWLLLGAVAGLSAFGASNVAIYVLFIAGNGAWALVHLSNFPPGARHLLRTLPHFCLGVPMTVMFLRYGLVGSFTAHFVWNMIPLLPWFVSQTMRGVPLTLRGSD